MVMIYLPYTNQTDNLINLFELQVYNHLGALISISYYDVWADSESGSYMKSALTDGSLTTMYTSLDSGTVFTLTEYQRDHFVRVSFASTIKISSVKITNSNTNQNRIVGAYVSVFSCGTLTNTSITTTISTYQFSYTTC